MRKPLTHRRLAVVGAVTAFALLGACGGNDAKTTNAASDKTTAAPSGATTTDKVTVKDFAFGPKSISVKAGSTVTWTNEDSFDHAVEITALNVDGPNFGPQTMPTSYSHQFDTPGTYPYICGVHNSMTGSVIVTN